MTTDVRLCLIALWYLFGSIPTLLLSQDTLYMQDGRVIFGNLIREEPRTLKLHINDPVLKREYGNSMKVDRQEVKSYVDRGDQAEYRNFGNLKLTLFADKELGRLDFYRAGENSVFHIVDRVHSKEGMRYSIGEIPVNTIDVLEWNQRKRRARNGAIGGVVIGGIVGLLTSAALEVNRNIYGDDETAGNLLLGTAIGMAVGGAAGGIIAANTGPRIIIPINGQKDKWLADKDKLPPWY